MPWKRLLECCLIVAVLNLAACSVDGVVSQAQPDQENQNPAALPGATSDDSGWEQIDVAMELRTVRMATAATAAEITLVRFDPAAYKTSVKYDVLNPGTVRDWFQALKPLVVINGGYFDEAGRATALVIFDGIRVGSSYEGFGGMVLINERGELELRSLSQQPYDPSENLSQAMQSAPMLIQPGGQLAEVDDDATDRARRSVIARDRSGRILLIVCNSSVFTLGELAQVLYESDLDLDAALNLDGGRSTGMFVGAQSRHVSINSLERVPLVLVVERRPES